MHRSFYESAIADAQTLPELKIIHRFLICDFQIMGNDNEVLRKAIAHRESCILLSQVEKVPGVK